MRFQLLTLLRSWRPEVHLYSICWNEAHMLEFFFRHFDPVVSRYVFYDDGSSDGTLEILGRHPRTEIRPLRARGTGFLRAVCPGDS